MTTYLLVTGTDTGVGKTVATAVLARAHQRAGRDVIAVKPVQTGVRGEEPGDAAVVSALSGVEAVEVTRLPEPLAPQQAAARAGAALPEMGHVADRIRRLRADTVLVEGAGGVSVALDAEGADLLDLGHALRGHGPVEVVVVCRSGLGTLNHTQLTVAAVRAAGHQLAGVLIGSWPAQPSLVDRLNRADLPRLTGAPLLGHLPAGLVAAGAAAVDDAAAVLTLAGPPRAPARP